jgi:nitrate/nitrite transporter NarK
MLSYPKTEYLIHTIRGPVAFHTEMGLVPFVVTVFILGFFMSLGKAAVYKHIPVYYPKHVGAVGGLVGMIGGLGGFVLPILFGRPLARCAKMPTRGHARLFLGCLAPVTILAGSTAWNRKSTSTCEKASRPSSAVASTASVRRISASSPPQKSSSADWRGAETKAIGSTV